MGSIMQAWYLGYLAYYDQTKILSWVIELKLFVYEVKRKIFHNIIKFWLNFRVYYEAYFSLKHD
jgi:hypothetical protein